MKASPLLPLDTLSVGECGIVCTLPDNLDIRHRLLSLGMIIGTKTTVVNVSPAGDPKAYFFRGAVIALRQKDAHTVLVKKVGESFA